MDRYWKVKNPYEKAYLGDLGKLYGHVRYFKTAAEAEHRCQELNEAHDQELPLRGTFSFIERFIYGGVPEDQEAKEVFGL